MYSALYLMIHEDLISVPFPTPEAIEMQRLPKNKQYVKNITRDTICIEDWCNSNHEEHKRFPPISHDGVV